ncbi:unnamed protein product [Parnassius apollo]|uniref:(apollo) hypothetical protein n=1 Tax=Parnassius apollo TaxID=110799 RepID=A0A8S3X3T0_PARAO|nr:unnamed protein product [Parnassius apollo]
MGQNQPCTEVVCEEQFNEAIMTILEGRHDKEKPTHQATGYGGRDKMLYNLKSRYLNPTSVVLEFLKLCTHNVLATESIDNNATPSEEQLTIEPNEDNTSTSAILTHELSAEPPVVSKSESVVRVQEINCIVLGQESTGAHSCDICGNSVHAICGITTSEG